MSNTDPTIAEPIARRARPRARQTFAVARASRLVAAMKMLLPAIALCLVALVVIWPQLLQEAQKYPMRGKPINASDADTLRVANPRFIGVDEKDRPYEIIAASARQESESSDAVHLEQPQADMITDMGDWITLTAGQGVWHKRDEVVDLAGGVSVFHEAGHQLVSDTARISLGAGTAESDNATSGQSPGGNVQGEGFRLYDRGARIVFTGRAKAVLYGSGTSG
ncbi:LPS export ABC transporter periplasmic protein LptC [Thalassobaculum sp.]|uniref:LPS export ABC transporter periplasmic protein LptC n=1 Tax=Thalassobaculum sp. TaxID=2022740 RepID=UPI0032EDC7EC